VRSRIATNAVQQALPPLLVFTMHETRPQHGHPHVRTYCCACSSTSYPKSPTPMLATARTSKEGLPQALDQPSQKISSAS
jgi:hypothetical protein